MTSTNPDLQEGERIDGLGVRGWRIIQREDEFRFSLDAVLLAHFATLRSHSRVVDLGCGGGAVALFLLSRGAAAVTGVELNPRLAGMAERTAQLNGLADRLKIICEDVGQIRSHFSAGAFDLVAANPPYRNPTSGRVSPTSGVAMARHESGAGLREFVQAAAFSLRYRGRLAMIHLPERLVDLCTEMRNADLEPKRLRFVHPFSDRAPRMVLVEAVKGSRAGLSVLPPLVVYQAPRAYHPEVLSYYNQ
jgi:tRNA1Val (adenine37-N6)-methyltransferase